MLITLWNQTEPKVVNYFMAFIKLDHSKIVLLDAVTKSALIFFCRSSTPKTTADTQNGASPDYVTMSTQATPSAEVVKCRVCGLPANAIFHPCGHVVACMECATMLKKCFRCKVKCSVLMIE